MLHGTQLLLTQQYMVAYILDLNEMTTPPYIVHCSESYGKENCKRITGFITSICPINQPEIFLLYIILKINKASAVQNHVLTMYDKGHKKFQRKITPL